MKLNRISWTTFFFLSLISVAIWLKFSYPQLAITNFSVNRAEALAIAEDYLRAERKVVPEDFQSAAVFRLDGQTNRYLQKTVGFQGLKKFIEDHNFDMFVWLVRFYKENDKEAYNFTIDSATGEITGFTHIIDDNAARKTIERDAAREHVKKFLTENFGFDPKKHILRSNLATIRDNRSDFHFSWQKRSVNIPWSDQPNSGTGKLIIKATISGDEILSFSKNTFLVPDQFNRDLDNRRDLGRNIMLGIKIIVLVLLTSGIFLIIVRQNHLAMHSTKKFYINIMLFIFILSLLTNFNQFQEILFSYKTTLPFDAYLFRNGINTIIGALFATVAILIPSLSGELLHYEVAPKQKEGALLHYIQSTFASRSVAELIALGYFVCMIMLGIQSFLVKIGQDHLGVWVEHSWVNNASTAYLPFLAAFIFGCKASLSEEIMYRLFAINLGKKLLQKIFVNSRKINTIIIVVLTSLIWGFAHSNYPIFPMWFRGLEVSCLGIFLAFIYLKFGLIPVIVGHYLFDVFWNTAGYIFGTSNLFYFYSSLCVLLLPLIIGMIAFLINRKEKERPLRWHLNKHQLFNLEILKTSLGANASAWAGKSQEQIKKEMISHGWDPAVVNTAMEDLSDTKSKGHSG